MKTYEVIYTSGALGDLAALEDYIEAESSGEIAARYIAKLIRECDSLAWSPHRGTQRSNIRPNMRIIGYKRAVSILFRREEAAQRIIILGLSYRGRSIEEILVRNE